MFAKFLQNPSKVKSF